MNKIAKLMCLVALVAFVGTSCKKTEKVQSFEGILGEMVEESAERMYIDGIHPTFEQGDQVMLYNINYTDPEQSESGLYEAASTASSTLFTPVEPMTNTTRMDAFFAYYPGNLCSPDVTEENRCTFELPSTQNYRTNANNNPILATNAMYAASKDEQTAEIGGAQFNFDQIGGILKLRLYTNVSKRVKSITITDNVLNLSGFVSMKIDKVDPTTLMTLLNNFTTFEDQAVVDYIEEVGYHAVGNCSKSVTLNLVTEKYPQGMVLGTNSQTATTFFIGLRPLACYAGFTVKVTYMDNSTYEFQTTKPNKINPGVIKSMPALRVY